MIRVVPETDPNGILLNLSFQLDSELFIINFWVWFYIPGYLWTHFFYLRQ